MSTATFGSTVAWAALLLAIAATTSAAQDSTSHQSTDRGPSALARRSAGSITIESATHLVIVRFGARIGL